MTLEILDIQEKMKADPCLERLSNELYKIQTEDDRLYTLKSIELVRKNLVKAELLLRNDLTIQQKKFIFNQLIF